MFSLHDLHRLKIGMLLLARRKATLSLARSFSTSPFLEKTRELLNEMQQHTQKTEEVNKVWLAKQNDERLPEGGIYKHPYCTDEHPIALHGDHMFRTMLEVMGPEQVSPHFQPIEEFGKWFNYFFVFLGFTVAMRSHQNHAFGYCVLNMMFGLEIWLYGLGLYFMRCTAMSVPDPWKVLWMKYNMDSMLNSVYELEENIARQRRELPISQVDYLRVHNEYLGTKAALLDKYMKTSRLMLKKHTFERALGMLRSTERFEKDNLSRLLREMLQEAMKKVTQDLAGPKGEQIKKDAFISALTGIRKGKMTYEGDPLLPLVLEHVDSYKQEVEKWSQEE
jgi:hypothetical protein